MNNIPVSVLFRGGVNDGKELPARIPQDKYGINGVFSGNDAVTLHHSGLHATDQPHISFTGEQPAKETTSNGCYRFTTQARDQVIAEWRPYNQPKEARPILQDIIEYLALPIVGHERELTREQLQRAQELRDRVAFWFASGYIMTGKQPPLPI